MAAGCEMIIRIHLFRAKQPNRPESAPISPAAPLKSSILPKWELLSTASRLRSPACCCWLAWLRSPRHRPLSRSLSATLPARRSTAMMWFPTFPGCRSGGCPTSRSTTGGGLVFCNRRQRRQVPAFPGCLHPQVWRLLRLWSCQRLSGQVRSACLEHPPGPAVSELQCNLAGKVAQRPHRIPEPFGEILAQAHRLENLPGPLRAI